MSFLNIKWSPDDYVETAVIAREAAEGLLARLNWMTIKPTTILDLGCGAGEFSKQLHASYPSAHVIALDLSTDMLMHSKTESISYLCANSSSLPLKDQTIDLIVANFLLPWQRNIEAWFKECKRVLKPNGLLMLSALGPDTLQVGREKLGDEYFPNLIDMHDVGDALLQHGFADPVLDVDYCTLVYSNQEKLIYELTSSGMLSEHAELTLPVNEEGKWNLTYEIVFAHAFAPESRDEFSASTSGEVRIPLSYLRRNLSAK